MGVKVSGFNETYYYDDAVSWDIVQGVLEVQRAYGQSVASFQGGAWRMAELQDDSYAIFKEAIALLRQVDEESVKYQDDEWQERVKSLLEKVDES